MLKTKARQLKKGSLLLKIVHPYFKTLDNTPIKIQVNPINQVSLEDTLINAMLIGGTNVVISNS